MGKDVVTRDEPLAVSFRVLRRVSVKRALFAAWCVIYWLLVIFLPTEGEGFTAPEGQPPIAAPAPPLPGG